MKKIILVLVKNGETYYTEVPAFLKTHYIKKYFKQGYYAQPWDFNTKKMEEDNENHIPFI